MERNDSYKPSGIPWLKEIPAHWQTRKIRSLYALRSEKVSDKDYEPLSVSKQGVTPQLEDAVKTDNGDNRKLVRKGDFVVNSRSDRKGSCGVSEFDGSVSVINIVTYPIADFDSRYFHLMFRSNDYIEEFYRLGKGIVADLWTTKFDEMRNISVPFPPREEQEKIVEFLSTKTLQIDAQQRERERELRLLDELKQAEIANVVTRGLNPNAPLRDTNIPWLPKIPVHWQTPKFYHLFDFIGGNGFPIHLQGKQSGDYPFYKTSDINGDEIYIEKSSNYLSEDDLAKNSFTLIPSGAFLMSKIGAALRKNHRKITTCQCFIDNNLQALVRKPTNQENELYLFYFLKFFDMAWVDNNGTIPCVDNGKLRICIFPVPPLEEQKAIVEYIQQKNKAIDEMIANLRAEIDFLTEYKQRLIADAVTGQLKID